MSTIARTASTASTAASVAGAELDAGAVARMAAAFAADPAARLARNAVVRAPAAKLALDHDVVAASPPTFSHRLDDWKATSQGKSGRCWLFAALNLLRAEAIGRMKVEQFEFSQAYLQFWDKLERANWFLESIIETAGAPVDDRTVAWLLDHPLDDGGQWNMFAALVRKHGLVPKSAMPETDSSGDTATMNRRLCHLLRVGAARIRELRGNGAPMEAARAAKRETLGAVHRVLCIHLGTPPDRFDWQWRDKDKSFHRDGESTPQEFAAQHGAGRIADLVCLVHDPRSTSPMNRVFTVRHLGNVVGGEPVRYLNVPVETLKELSVAAIEAGEPVWFGCDVGPMMDRDLGLWDAKLHDWEGLYGVRFGLDKARRLELHQTAMTHAMLFTGVDLVNGRSRRWRVENSWGETAGDAGFFTMNDSWFDEYVFEIAAPRERLPAPLLAALEEEPIVLPPWDPMGALAAADAAATRRG